MKPRRRRLVRAVAYAFGLSLPVAALALVVRAQASPVLVLDEALIRAATDVTRTNPGLRDVLLVGQDVLQARWVNLVCALGIVWVWRRHGLKTRAIWALVTLVASWGIANLVKELVQRARPVLDDAVAVAPGYSFPSGHSANAASAALTFTILVWPLLGPRARVAVPLGAAAVVVVTGLDRVFLGVHYPSDVVAGFLLGGAMVGASYLGYLGWTPSTEPEVLPVPDSSPSPSDPRPVKDR